MKNLLVILLGFALVAALPACKDMGCKKHEVHTEVETKEVVTTEAPKEEAPAAVE
jgi:hypothetical protein